MCWDKAKSKGGWCHGGGLDLVEKGSDRECRL